MVSPILVTLALTCWVLGFWPGGPAMDSGVISSLGMARRGASRIGASKTVRRKQNGTLESRDENRDLGLVKRVSKFVE